MIILPSRRRAARGTNISILRSANVLTFRRSNSPGGNRMHSRLQERRRVRVGIVGVGNCASSFVQGLTFYRDAKSNEPVPGLMNADLGGYHISDIQVASAFDVHAGKVGRDVAEAIFAAPNNTHRFSDVAPTGVVVQ